MGAEVKEQHIEALFHKMYLYLCRLVARPRGVDPVHEYDTGPILDA